MTVLDKDKLGLGFEVYATVKLNTPTRENLDAFESAVARWPEVVQCALVTGGEDYVLRIVTSDMHRFDDFLRGKLLAQGLVSDVHSRIVVRPAKDATALPLSLVTSHLS